MHRQPPVLVHAERAPPVGGEDDLEALLGDHRRGARPELPHPQGALVADAGEALSADEEGHLAQRLAAREGVMERARGGVPDPQRRVLPRGRDARPVHGEGHSPHLVAVPFEHPRLPRARVPDPRAVVVAPAAERAPVRGEDHPVHQPRVAAQDGPDAVLARVRGQHPHGASDRRRGRERREQEQRLGGIALDRRARLREEQLVAALGRSPLRRHGELLSGFGLATGGDDHLEAHPAGDDQHAERHGGDRDRDPVPAQEADHDVTQRVLVCADEAAGEQAPEVVGQLAGAAVALPELPAHRLLDDGAELERHARSERGDGRWWARAHLRHDGPGVLALVGRAAGDDAVENRAQRVDVRPLVDGLPRGLLR